MLMSSLISSENATSDMEAFETAAQILRCMSGDGNLAASEFSRNLDEIKVSLEGTRNVIDDLIDSFCEEASIVVAISVASRFIASEQPLSYHLGKAALEQLVRYYAVTLGPKGIRVNGVSFASVLKKESKHYYEENPDLMNLYRTITPLKRMGSASEIADGIAFLVSDSASFINGHNLIIDGGISLQWHESLARELGNFSKIDVTRDDDS